MGARTERPLYKENRDPIAEAAILALIMNYQFSIFNFFTLSP